MANKVWTHLKLKNGDMVQFAPPAPDGDLLGGVSEEEVDKFDKTATSIAAPYDSTATYVDGDFATFDGELRKMVSGEWQATTVVENLGGGSGLPEVEGSGKALVSVDGEWIEQSGYGYAEKVIIVQETINIDGTNLGRYSSSPIVLVPGNSYSVSYNGNTYDNLICRYDEWLEGYCIGENPQTVEEYPEDAEYPFYCSRVFIRTTELKNTQINLTITGESCEKIHNKYLPNSNVQNGTNTGSVVEGENCNASGYASHAEGRQTTASSYESHAEGDSTTASGIESHAEGFATTASGEVSHAEGIETESSGRGAHAEGNETVASKDNSHAEGSSSLANGVNSHAEGLSTIASGGASHAEGEACEARQDNSHAEGLRTVAEGYNSHAEGEGSYAGGDCSHAEGTSEANSSYSHSEGINTQANGGASHAEGSDSRANGTSSHAEGDNTIATGANSHVEGKYNISDTNNLYAHIIGNGTSINARHNAFMIGWDGAIYVQASDDATKMMKITVASDGTITATQHTM